MVSGEALAELEKRPWYGNVRELRNAIEHAMILVRGNCIAPEHLPAPTPPANSPGASQEEQIACLIRQWGQLQLSNTPQAGDLYDRFLRLVEPPLLEVVMQQSRGQCAIAARQLGLHRTTLRKKLNAVGIRGA